MQAACLSVTRHVQSALSRAQMDSLYAASLHQKEGTI